MVLESALPLGFGSEALEMTCRTVAGRVSWPGITRLAREDGKPRDEIVLSLPNADLAVARVAERVLQGGHQVPEEVVRRRFAAGLANFFGLYSSLVDSWEVYDNADLTGPRLIAARVAGCSPMIMDASAWENLKELQR